MVDLSHVNDSETLDVSERRIHDSNYVLNEIKKLFLQSTDEFGRAIRLNTRNVADVASHYPYSPERYRVFVDGARQYIMYDGFPAQYRDEVDYHVLAPQTTGEVVTLETTEIYRYVVGYVLEWSFALQANQALQSGDAVAVAYGDPDLENSTDDTPGPNADGWFWLWDSGLAENEVRLAIYRDGTEKFAEVVDTETLLTEWTRRATETNWYNVGASQFLETFTESGEQFNHVVGRASVDNDRGPEEGNKHLKVSVKAGDGAGSLELEVGSFGIRVLGDTTPLKRRKTSDFTTTISTANTFVPIHAFHVDPDNRLVTTELTDVRVPEFSGNGDIKVVPFAFSIDKLRDSGGNPIVDGDFSVPAIHSARNSVIRETSAVAQFPDSTGSIVTSTTDPGGYQEGYAANYSSGGQSKNQSVSQQERRLLAERDVIVFLANAGATGDVTVEYVTEQQW